MKQLFDQTFIWGFVFGVTLCNLGYKMIKLSKQSDNLTLDHWFSVLLSITLMAMTLLLYRKNRNRISKLENTIELVAESSQR